MNTRKKYGRKAMASIVMYGLFFWQFVQWAEAATSTDIADVPMAVKSRAPPNIMFTLDNSGSMTNIVPDTPYTGSPLFIPSTGTGSCPTANVVAGGVAAPAFPASSDTFDIRIINNVQKIHIGSNDYDYGTGSGQKCFNPVLRYNARLVADSSCGFGCVAPGSYLDTIYTGDYLNWYFGSAPTSWGAGATRKPGTSNRIEIARNAGKLVLDSLTLRTKLRVGLSTYNSGEGGSLREIMGDLSTNVSSMKTKIDALTPGGNTPLAETLSDIGRYFATGNSGNLTIHPGQSNQASVSVSDFFTANTGPGSRTSALTNNSGQTVVAPIQYSCQRNFVVFMSDGQSQGDQQMSSYLVDYKGDYAANPSLFIAGTPGGSTNNFGRKVGRNYESEGSDYFDDVAKALFDIDLRPDLTPPSGTTKGKSNVSTYTIGFADVQVINDPLMQDAATAGGGLFLRASNSAELANAFQAAANDILSKDSSASAVAVSISNVVAGDNTSYATRYDSGPWTGDLLAYPIGLTTGVADTTHPIWNSSAQAQLDQTTPTGRKIVSYTGAAGPNQGIQFQPTTASTPTKLSTAQQNLLNSTTTPPGPADGADIVAYLRGNRSKETNGTYRLRAHLLGDIIHAEPVEVRAPFANYGDTGYRTYKATNASRTKIILQGANDGMVHAFNAATGAEEWAYVPNLLMANLNNLASKNTFSHKFYVDATPVASDVDFNNTGGSGGSGDWRTIAVGGLGKGGRGYYALDVTTTTFADEAAVASKVLWEFPNSATNATVKLNVGYSFGRPIITKTRAQGWVVLVTSGYNNGTNPGDSGGDGQGYLFVLNAQSGALIKAIGTGVGSATDPSGFARISGYVAAGDIDNTVEYVYGGDLKGNVWRFDLTGSDSNSWNVRKLAALADGSGNFQPVTTEPELANVRITSGAYKRFVYVGTGRYLGDTDIPGTTGANANASQTQAMYGLVDDLSDPGVSGTVIPSPRTSLLQQTFTASGADRNASAASVNFSTQKGWFIDLPGAGERVDTNPALAFGALVFTSNLPSPDACLPGGRSFINVLDYQSGGYLNTNTTLTHSSIALDAALASGVVMVQLPDGSVVGLVQQSNNVIRTVPVRTGIASTTSRRSWMELMR